MTDLMTRACEAIASTLGPVRGYEQIEPTRVPQTDTELALAEARENMQLAWDAIDQVERAMDEAEGQERPRGLMMDALERSRQAETAFQAAWDADNKAKAVKLAEIELEQRKAALCEECTCTPLDCDPCPACQEYFRLKGDCND